VDHLKRCKQCNKWTDGDLAFCSYCGFEHNLEANKEKEERKKKGDIDVPILRIHDTDPTWLKVVKRPFQVIQLVLYAIIGFLIYLSTAFAH